MPFLFVSSLFECTFLNPVACFLRVQAVCFASPQLATIRCKEVLPGPWNPLFWPSVF